MNLLFQFAVFSFIAFSFLLVIGVPVAFAGSSSFSWNENKNTFFTGIALWFIFVFFVGILNSFVV
uniref:Photosystem II reaction center protein Z n=1 Tax=Tydemania expeditionis TaxID=325645 RepID=A0A0D6E1G4_TYDEX|nr:photosystem II protein Z [Tydemania expeditionis]CEO91056.1 photosystem II protein Z [Tydemania expeditionis]